MPSSSNLLCGCGLFMRVKQNGVTVEEMTTDRPPQPYKLWRADLYTCACGNEVLTGFGSGPIAEHWQDEYYPTKKQAIDAKSFFQGV